MNKNRVKIILSVLLAANVTLTGSHIVEAVGDNKGIDITRSKISEGVIYRENQISYYTDDKGNKRKQRVNIIEVDMSNENADLIFSYAKNTALGREVLSKQINNTINKGSNVVGGINGDFFNPTIGISVGPQVHNGTMITGFTCKSDESRYPILTIDKDNKASIDKLVFDGKINVLKSLREQDNSQANTSEQSNNSDLDNFFNSFFNVGSEEDNKTFVNIDSINRYDEFRVNKYTVKNQLMVLTPNYSESRVINQSTYAPSDVFVKIILKDNAEGKLVNGGIELDKEYIGCVQEIVEGNSKVVIPQNGFIIAANGTKAEWIKKNVINGDIIKLKASFNKKDIEKAITGYTYLVKDGQPVTLKQLKSSGLSNSVISLKRARTAVGVTMDNKVVTAVVEGGRGDKDVSDGATLLEMAEIMRNLGAVNAINLDGGGSSQMNLKDYGSNSIKIINSPSDGRERKVSNTILIENKIQSSDELGSMKIVGEKFVYKNSSVKFNLSGETKSNTLFNFSGKKVKWSSDNSIGTINSQGIFTSGNNMGMGKITAELDGVKTTMNIIITDKIYDLKLNCGDTLCMNYSDTFDFVAYGESKTGQEIAMNEDAVKWSVKGNIGTIDSKGVFKVTAKKGSGVVTAEAGGKKNSVKVFVEKDALILDDFEGNTMYNIDGFVGGIGEISQEQAWNRNGSLKVSYDYDKNWTRQYNGTINIRPNGDTKKFISYTRPQKIGVCVYGDGKAPWLRAQFIDGNGEKFSVDLIKKIDWSNYWQNVYGEIPKNAVLPIKLNYIYMVETNKEEHKKGTVYFDDLRYVYTNEENLNRTKLTSKITDVEPAHNGIVKTPFPLIKGKIHDSTCRIDESSLKVTIDGKEVQPYYNSESGEFYAIPDFQISRGKHVLIVNGKNIKGLPARRVYKEFLVEY